MTAPTVRPPARTGPPRASTGPTRPARPARPARPGGPDPRIVARRIEVKRTEGRKRLRRLLLLLGGMGLVAAAGAATRTPLLDVDHVRIAGADRVPAEEIAAAVAGAGAGRGEPLSGVDAAAVARAVEALPGVADASVERRWPGTIEVEVVERTPVAAIATDGGVAVVAADGVVLEVLPVAPAWAVTVEGPSVDAEPGAVADAPELLTVAASLPPSLAAAVDAVTVGPDDELQLRLADPEGGLARLGSVDELADKLTAVATVVEQVDLACLATIDVRVPSAPAVTRTPGCGS